MSYLSCDRFNPRRILTSAKLLVVALSALSGGCADNRPSLVFHGIKVGTTSVTEVRQLHPASSWLCVNQEGVDALVKEHILTIATTGVSVQTLADPASVMLMQAKSLQSEGIAMFCAAVNFEFAGIRSAVFLFATKDGVIHRMDAFGAYDGPFVTWKKAVTEKYGAGTDDTGGALRWTGANGVVRVHPKWPTGEVWFHVATNDLTRLEGKDIDKVKRTQGEQKAAEKF